MYRTRTRISGVINSLDAIAENGFFQADGHWNVEDRPQEFGIEQVSKLENKEFESILLKCIQKLPALWMIIFNMKFIDDEPTEKICSDLKLSSGNYWVIIHRAKVNIRACLQRNWL